MDVICTFKQEIENHLKASNNIESSLCEEITPSQDLQTLVKKNSQKLKSKKICGLTNGVALNEVRTVVGTHANYVLRVKATISCPIDEIPRTVNFMIDTGATCTCLNHHWIEDLQLIFVSNGHGNGSQTVTLADGSSLHLPKYLINIQLDGVKHPILALDMGPDSYDLLGMDVLEKYKIILDGLQQPDIRSLGP